jgi:DNA repair protein RecN (Recombination protein N)
MKGAKIDFRVEPLEELSSTGLSKVNFMAELNPGEGFYQVKSIASGGELSRILLSFRKAISNSDSISVFLFDEIDTGIGGETALSIGKALCEVSQNSQVIAITHLPQIAHYADELINVSKQTVQEKKTLRTFSNINVIKNLAEMEKAVKAMSPLESIPKHYS